MYPFAKQVYRQTAADGTFKGDLITRATEQVWGEPLLVPVLRQGQLVQPLPTLDECRTHRAKQLARLPGQLLDLERHPTYPVRVSQGLKQKLQHLAARRNHDPRRNRCFER
jgi:nicotinate phosphoribosyltransferase